MPNLSPEACRRGYEEQGRDCGGECWTDSCPLRPQPVAPSALNGLALEVHAAVAAVGWDGMLALGMEWEMTARQREHVLWAIGLLRAYYAAVALPDRERDRAVTELLDG